MLQDSEVEDGGGDEVLADEVEREFGCMKAVTDLMLSTLPKRERNILRLRYGLLG
jgi:DNA-directed RNA polymerase sigma subunit (sigma70/sigma32)